MAEIILAEHRGGTWLVGGEQYIDDLLANTLPGDVSIRFVACQSQSDIRMLWIDNCGEQPSGDNPCLIHPAIAARSKGKPPGHTVVFGPWSALIDDGATGVIRGAAAWAAEFNDLPVLLVAEPIAGGPRAIADLLNLRYGLIEAELVTLGVAEARISRATRDPGADPAREPNGDQIEIVIKKPV